MRGDYLETFNSQFEGGLLDFYTNGAFYTNTRHNHAITTTAAGHATIATGFFPSHHGIVTNTVYNRELGYSHYSIEDSTVNFIGIDSCSLNKVSAKRLMKSSFGDILKQHNENSKTYSVALKDRASILMGGKNANRAFWFDVASTQMVSTDYYKEEFPKWVQNYKADSVMSTAIHHGWKLDPAFATLSSTNSDSFSREKGSFKPWFPHTIESFDTNRIRQHEVGSFMWNTPFGDEYVLNFGYNIISHEELGKDENCDILTIGLSAADIIGHHFGPDSYEVLDYYNKLDKYLADFMSKVNTQVGKENVVYILTSDHGVAPMPEVLAGRGLDAKRIENEKYDTDILAIDLKLQQKYNLDSSCILRANYNGVEPHFLYLNEKGIDSIDFVNSLQHELSNLDYIQETFSFFELNSEQSNKEYFEQMKNSHSNDYGVFVKILGKENYLIDMRENGTTHGTPYPYDTHVPLIFLGRGIPAHKNSDKSYTVDIAPTILSILKIEPKTPFDGRILTLELSSK